MTIFHSDIAKTGRRAPAPVAPCIHLPKRRPSETRVLEWGWHAIEVTIGYDADGTARELAYAGGFKQGSEMAHLMVDLCRVVSVMLQASGMDIARMRAAMSRDENPAIGEDRPASLLGLLLDQLDEARPWVSTALAVAAAGRA